MSQVFISYRRDDSADVTGRIYEHLARKYGRDNVFKDDAIPLGVDFRAFLDEKVGGCRVLLAVIGRDWLRIAGPSGGRRLDDPRDFVRLEIEAALGRGIPVIPVLVGGAAMPGDDHLPAPLQPLAFRNGIAVRRDPDFRGDMKRLMKNLDPLLQGRLLAPAPSPPASHEEVTRFNSPPSAGPEQAEVFVSYSSRDLYRVVPIVRHLEAAGVSVWHDGDRILGGQYYGEQIVHAIAHSRVVLLMCSPESFGSDNVHREVLITWDYYHRRYLPVWIAAPVEVPERFHYCLAGCQWIDVMGQPEEQWLPRMLEALKSLGVHLRQETGSRAPPSKAVNSLGMNLVPVAAGTFWMGERGSQTEVTIPHNYYIGTCPVTQGQWQALMGSNPSWFSRSGSGADKVSGFSDDDLRQFPVEQVSWDEVQEFLKRLNASEENSGFMYRLPTEAEWEYACRGGATTQAECAFDYYFAQPTNDLSAEQANFDGNRPAGSAPQGKYLERTSKVGSYPPNRLGIYDMHGNVWEWCEDHFETGGSARVFRGGCWHRGAALCRASRSFRREPALRHHYVGFRLAAVPSGE
jgi:formylglycine-generating enzyme required for sulfatase activity